MTCYTISYDLLKPGQDYAVLFKRLEELKAVRLEYSEWLLWDSRSALDIAKDLLRFMDTNDRLLVAQLTSNCAWYNLMVDTDTMRKIVPAA